jgi:transaldolase
MVSAPNPLQKLAPLGQSVWCDNIERRMIREKTFERMIREDDLRGVTSNPTIFEKAITGSSDYDADLVRFVEKGLDTEAVYWALVIQDIEAVADVFRPVYDRTQGLDGYVSIEVNPHLARDTRSTIAQAKELWKRLGRPNIMVKIPATKEGLPAIEAAIREGLNINVTLIFSLDRYREVMEVYLAGLEARLADGKPVSGIASVASFFVSRVDTETDKRLEAKIAAAKSDSEKAALRALCGQAAVANSRLAYAEYEKVFKGARFRKLAERGARVQRPLWASTSTKNPAYRDVVYVEELIGPDTVNTLPPATIDAFRDHGRAEPRLHEGLAEARKVFADLGAHGIDLADVTHQLEVAGVQAFSDSYTKLLQNIQAKEVRIGAKSR